MTRRWNGNRWNDNATQAGWAKRKREQFQKGATREEGKQLK